jgi:two-component system chemotaxis sensor kinase CheA
MKREVDDTTKEIILSFISEGLERLDDAEAQLGKLGSGEDDTERLNAIFRLFHSLKGSAGFLDFKNVGELTHRAENLLTALIKHAIALDGDKIDLVYSAVDVLRRLVNLVATDFSDEDGAELAEGEIAALEACLGGSGSEPAAVQAASAQGPAGTKGPAAPSPADPAPAATDPAAAGSAVEADSPQSANVIRLSLFITRDMVDNFKAECLDLLDRSEKTALGMAHAADPADAIHEIFRAVHTIKGNAGAFGHSLLESRAMDLESLLDKARSGSAAINEAFGDMVISRIDQLRRLLAGVAILEAGAPVPIPEAGEDESDEAGYKHIGEILVATGVLKPEDLKKGLEIQHAQAAKAERAGGEEIQRKEIRVDTAKLDKLFDLVGELITAEAMVLNSPDLRGLKLDNFNKSFAGLNKISREIQETTMMIRMIPLEGLFQKMTRLVRDLTRKFNKPNNFRVSGAETEMDKNVIEQISDPLVHIIRNALDHGLEPPAARKAAGKEEKGNILLDARYEGSEIWISIQDDGAGLKRDKILAKAQDRNLLSADPETMPDSAVWQLIFEPGFSTADVITDVSGRGVGMDVVKKNIERIRGQVDIHTTPGKGTTFILKIPLTMAIIDGITLRAGSNFYSIPLGDILEFFQAHPEQLTSTEKGEQTVNVRGSILPLVKLGEVFSIPGANLDPTQGIILVVQSKGQRACLLIDEVVGNQQIVVKSLSEYLGRVDGISGCSILGDGMVSFIIDTGRLLSLRLE